MQVSSFQAAAPEVPAFALDGGPAATSPAARARVPAAPRQLPRTPVTWRIGPQHPALIRYNRVEALSLGARLQMRPATPLGPLSLSLTGRIGVADAHPDGRLDIERETLERRVAVSGYHELTSIDERARHFGAGNSLSALLWGQDDGDYYRRSGASVEVAPPTAEPRSFSFRVFAEYHQSVEKNTDAQFPRLWDEARSFQPNLVAAEGWELGGSLDLTSRSGTDRTRTRGQVRAFVQAATGSEEYARASVGAAVALVLPARTELFLEAEGGTSWGSPSVQRLWYVGGPVSLRGYGSRALGGDSFGRVRAEFSRSYVFGRLIVFSDAGWAGELERLEIGRALRSVGAGVALVDGLARFDGAWQLERPHRFRLDMYLREPL